MRIVGKARQVIIDDKPGLLDTVYKDDKGYAIIGNGTLPHPLEVDDSEKFPNGFTNWHETHFEVVQAIGDRLGGLNDRNENCIVQAVQYQMGHGGLYELAQELTDKFEKKFKGVEWGIEEKDGEVVEFYDTIEEFLEKELSKEV